MTEDAKELSRHAARTFAEKWSKQKTEKQLAQSFWSDFFHLVVGIEDLMATGIEFEYPIKNVVTKTTNFIDVFWAGTVLIEHKSAGKDLNLAEQQARDYLASLAIALRPRIIVISDFARIRVVDVIAGQSVEFDLSELPTNLDRFDAIFMAKGERAAHVEVEADIKAAEIMSALYVEFEKNKYEGHAVSVLLIRVLFLLFGDDTQMWKAKAFESIVREANAAALGGRLQQLFEALDKEKDERPGNLDPALSVFPYVNGGLFKESLPVFSFTEEMRDRLLAACDYTWANISPAIFGAMLQTIKKKEERRALGEHYTSEANILKVIRPLFLDDYLERMRKSWDDAKGLRALRKELGTKRFLDPAAGSGNFLVVAYRRLREIEHKIIARLIELEGKLTSAGGGGFNLQVGLDATIGLALQLEQFRAIEYEEWSSQIATVAMFLTDHQLNLALEELTGLPPNRFPLKHSAVVRAGNALRLDWREVCPIDNDTFIMGNPPFYGARQLSDEQREDMGVVFGNAKGVNELDYVTAWFFKAAKYMEGTTARAAFVATNSITQGEQPPYLWPNLTPLGMGIDFAHRTFEWANDASGQASVHCVIVGFSANAKGTTRPLWSYETVKSEPVMVAVRNINAYLLDAPDVLVPPRSRPLDPRVQKLVYGSMPNDNGHLAKISPETAEEIRATDPIAAKYLRRIVGAKETINNLERYCLWLKSANPQDLRDSPVLSARIEEVRKYRARSKRARTIELAAFPALFGEIRQPDSDYLIIPRHSSENRDYFPIARMSPEVITNDAVFLVPDPSLVTFGVLSSRVFEVWTKGLGGRLKNDPRISSTLTYNNFVFPSSDEASTKKIEEAAQGVLDARDLYPDASLAVLYAPNSTPEELLKAHIALDRAVLNAYGLRITASEVGILERLFALYAELINGLLAEAPTKRKRV